MANSINSEYKPQPKEESSKIDDTSLQSLLSKYSTIWIWSIIVGINSGLTYTFYNSRIGNYGSLTLILIIFNIVPFTMSALTWVSLYRVLNYVILPNLFPELTPLSKEESILNAIHSGESEVKVREIELMWRKNEVNALARKLISTSLKFVILALVFRFASYAIEGAFTALSSSFTKSGLSLY